MCNLEQFIKSYWYYYLELEEQFIETKRYVAFDKNNAKSYSTEYLKLYQAVCSEIDVVGKEIAAAVNPKFKIDKSTNIKKWGYEIQQRFTEVKDVTVIFNEGEAIQPFKDWEYEKILYYDKNGKERNVLKIKDDKKTIQWWHNYNAVKHRRIGLVEGTKNYRLANQRNLIYAFSALFVLETLYIASISEYNTQKLEESKLFTLHTKD